MAPGRTSAVLGIEILVVGVLTGIGSLAGGLHRRRGRPIGWSLIAMVAQLVPAALLIAGGALEVLDTEGALYWVMGAFVTGFAAAVSSAWILLVQVQRRSSDASH